MSPRSTFPGVYTLEGEAGKALATLNLTPGRRFYGEQLVNVEGIEYRTWNPYRSKLAAGIVKGRKLAANIKLALVVPGSGLVKQQAEEEGLDRIFVDAGFEWREPGCSMCLGMNADRLEPGERCASTSNRNFEGRQGAGGRTHLVSPAMAAAAAVHGHFIDVRKLT